MSYDLQSRNNALNLNPSTLNGVTADISSTVRGSDVYFAISAIMGTTAIVILVLSAMKPRTDRIFFYISAALNATACIAYFTMGSNLGFAPIGVEFMRSNPKVAGMYRQVFYTRYIDWVVTTPLLLMDLMLTAALPWPTILWTIFLDEVMIITGLIGALVQSRYKFGKLPSFVDCGIETLTVLLGFFAIGCAAMFGVFYELAINGRKHARALGNDVHKCFMACGVLTLALWTLYPIAWGVSEGGNVIAPDSEAVFYGVLDVVAKPVSIYHSNFNRIITDSKSQVFSMMLIYFHWNISPSRLGLQIHDVAFENNREHLNEKTRTVQPNNNNEVTSNSYVPQDTSNSSSSTTTGHAAHTQGFAPAHERTTVEGGQHTATMHHDGERV